MFTLVLSVVGIVGALMFLGVISVLAAGFVQWATMLDHRYDNEDGRLEACGGGSYRRRQWTSDELRRYLRRKKIANACGYATGIALFVCFTVLVIRVCIMAWPWW